MERLAGKTHDAPFAKHARADLFVDGDRWGVPFEDIPLEARAAFDDRDLREACEERAANSLPSQRGCDVEVFEADAVVAEPGGVAGEVKREACGSRVPVLGELGDECAEACGTVQLRAIGCEREAVAEKVGLGGDDSVGFALVGGELADEAQHGWDVSGGGGANVEHAAASGPRSSHWTP